MTSRKMSKEGYLNLGHGKVWYKRMGNANGTPLILIHGGPGYPHFYLEPLSALSDKREIIFYDQLGCGNSDASTRKSLLTVENFVKELELLLKKLNIKKYHLLGHSWGATVAVAFASTKPKGMASIVLSDPYISTHIWERDAKMRLRQLPKKMKKSIARYQKDGKSTVEYKHASAEFYTRFVFGMKILSSAIKMSGKKQNRDIYNYMWGPEEYLVKGTLKRLDLSKNLRRINVPVLLLCGYYDEASPNAIKYFKSLLPMSQAKVFNKSAHFPFWTERKEYMKVVKNFLLSTDSKDNRY